MKVTPRKAEVAEVVSLLESTDFDSADDLAKAIIKKVGELFSQRDWTCYAWRSSPEDGLVLAWGPLSSDSEVERLAKKVGLAGEHRSIKLYSTGRLLDGIVKGEAGIDKFCTTCNHPLGAHEHPGRAGKCQARGCRCASGVKRK